MELVCRGRLSYTECASLAWHYMKPCLQGRVCVDKCILYNFEESINKKVRHFEYKSLGRDLYLHQEHSKQSYGVFTSKAISYPLRKESPHTSVWDRLALNSR